MKEMQGLCAHFGVTSSKSVIIVKQKRFKHGHWSHPDDDACLH